MCIDPECPKGVACVVPSLKEVMTPIDLIGAAKSLWAAECHSKQHCGISDTWGSVGLIFRDAEADREFYRVWAECFKENGIPFGPLNIDGVLDIDWPTDLLKSTPIDFDVLLATPTVAQEKWPSVDEISSAWIRQDNHHEKYFFECQKSGIRTFQDSKIVEAFVRRSPEWLPSYI